MSRDSRLQSRMTVRVPVTWITAVAMLAAVGSAAAQTTYPAAVESYCKEDYFRYCAPYALGTEELRRCMEANGKTLSRNCQQALKDAGYVKPDRLRKGS